MTKTTTLLTLCLLVAAHGARGQAIATTTVEETALEEQTEQRAQQRVPRRQSASLLRSEVFIEEEALKSAEEMKRWTLVPSFNWSFFNKGRDNWYEEDIQLFYQVNKSLLLGGEIDIMTRPPDTDILYSGMFSWYPWRFLEVHGKGSFANQPKFAPNMIWQGGFEYMLHWRVGVLFDYQFLYFAEGGYVSDNSISQIKPGLSLWITEKTFLTLRYARGWAYGTQTYNYYAGALNIGDMPGGGRLTLGFAYGTDPDLDYQTDRASLSNAYIYTVFYTQPITRDFSLFGGVQYVYRLKETDNSELYQQLTPTLGAVWKF